MEWPQIVQKLRTEIWPGIIRARSLPPAVLTNAPANASGQVIVSDASGRAAWGSPSTVSSLPTGPAGGDLGGTYPNPTVNDYSALPAAHASSHYQGGTDPVWVPVSTYAANATLAAGDEVALVTNAGVTISLPASPTTGQRHVIKDASAHAPVIVSGNGKNIDGSTTYTMSTNYQSITVVYGGSSWSII